MMMMMMMKAKALEKVDCKRGGLSYVFKQSYSLLRNRIQCIPTAIDSAVFVCLGSEQRGPMCDSGVKLVRVGFPKEFLNS